MASTTNDTPSAAEQEATIKNLESMFPQMEEAVAPFIEINSRKWSKIIARIAQMSTESIAAGHKEESFQRWHDCSNVIIQLSKNINDMIEQLDAWPAECVLPLRHLYEAATIACLISLYIQRFTGVDAFDIEKCKQDIYGRTVGYVRNMRRDLQKYQASKGV